MKRFSPRKLLLHPTNWSDVFDTHDNISITSCLSINNIALKFSDIETYCKQSNVVHRTRWNNYCSKPRVKHSVVHRIEINHLVSCHFPNFRSRLHSQIGNPDCLPWLLNSYPLLHSSGFFCLAFEAPRRGSHTGYSHLSSHCQNIFSLSEYHQSWVDCYNWLKPISGLPARCNSTRLNFPVELIWTELSCVATFRHGKVVLLFLWWTSIRHLS